MPPVKTHKRSYSESHGTGLSFKELIGINEFSTHPEFKIVAKLPNLKVKPGIPLDEKFLSFISRGHRALDKRLRKSSSALDKKSKMNWVFDIALRHLEVYEANLFRENGWEEYKYNSIKRIFQDNFGKEIAGIKRDITSLKKPTHIDYTNFPYVAGTLIRAGYVLSPSTKKFIGRIMKNQGIRNGEQTEEEFLIASGTTYFGRQIVLFKKAKL